MVHVYNDYNEKGCGCTVYILNPWLEVMYYWRSHTSSNSTDQYIGPGHLKGIILFVLIATRNFFAAANTVINNIMAGQYQLIYKYWGDSFIPCLCDIFRKQNPSLNFTCYMHDHRFQQKLYTVANTELYGLYMHFS